MRTLGAAGGGSGRAPFLVSPLHPEPDPRVVALAFDHLNDGVLVVAEDPRGEIRRILWANRAVCELTGYAVDELAGKPPEILLGPGTDPEALARLCASRAAGGPAREELLGYRKDGQSFWMEIDVTSIPDATADGGSHLVLVMRDVSERKMLVSRLLVADRTSAIGTLVAGVAHELNNPLTFLICNLDLVADSLATGERDDLDQMVRDAKAGAERISGIVRDLRVFSRADTDERRAVDPRAVLDASLHLAQKKVSDRATVLRRYSGETRILANESRLARAFLDLILNAAEAIPPGSSDANTITLAVEVVAASTVVTIEDSGRGIPDHLVRRVFDPFFTTKEVGHGMGLGLWTTRSTIEGFGGTIDIESVVNRGTRVRVTLPSADPF